LARQSASTAASGGSPHQSLIHDALPLEAKAHADQAGEGKEEAEQFDQDGALDALHLGVEGEENTFYAPTISFCCGDCFCPLAYRVGCAGPQSRGTWLCDPGRPRSHYHRPCTPHGT